MLGLPDARRIRRGLRAVSALPGRQLRSARARHNGPKLRRTSTYLTNTSGYRIFVRVTEPDDELVRPAVVLVPGRDKDGTVFDSALYPLTAREVASLGVRCIAFDPVGRGKSWGHDDFCGSEGQDALRAVLDYTHSRRDVRAGSVGVASFSLGLALAAPVLAAHGDRLPTAFLLDWEGPVDRDAILRSGDLPPAARAALARDPDVFWAHREPMPSMDDLPCEYIRIQARDDHALGPRGAQGAVALVAEAARGRAPHTRLNDNRPDVAWRADQVEEISWAPSSPSRLNRMLLEVLRERLAT
ncbi:MAG: hypothetical protein KDA24_29460 [Deltaproteobacteria bacterium]|nr:hypothetical protein [Deltaproteobacteria bacterium]